MRETRGSWVQVHFNVARFTPNRRNPGIASSRRWRKIRLRPRQWRASPSMSLARLKRHLTSFPQDHPTRSQNVAETVRPPRQALHPRSIPASRSQVGFRRKVRRLRLHPSQHQDSIRVRTITQAPKTHRAHPVEMRPGGELQQDCCFTKIRRPRPRKPKRLVSRFEKVVSRHRRFVGAAALCTIETCIHKAKSSPPRVDGSWYSFAAKMRQSPACERLRSLVGEHKISTRGSPDDSSLDI
jgi:hypothetical protein